MKNVKLIYFSGTGNTYLVMRMMQARFEMKGFNVVLEKMSDGNRSDENQSDEIKSKQNSSDQYSSDKNSSLSSGIDYELIGIVFPVAVQSTFPNVWAFVNQMPNGNGQKIFMADTMESYSGGVIGPMRQLLRSKGYRCIGAMEFKMPTSMQLSQKKVDQGILKSEKVQEEVEAYVDALIAGKTKWRRVPIFSDWMRAISKGKKIWGQMASKLSVSADKCIECQLCVSHCPVQALSSVLELKIAIDTTKCISCMRCVNYCPKNAFTLNGKTLYQKKNARLKDFS